MNYIISYEYVTYLNILTDNICHSLRFLQITIPVQHVPVLGKGYVQKNIGITHQKRVSIKFTIIKFLEILYCKL